MVITFKNYFVQQADYQHWANEALFSALEHLDEAVRQGDQGLAARSVQRTVAHMLAVQRDGFARLKGETGEAPHAEDWQALKDALRQELRSLHRWLGDQPEAWFEAPLTYQDGGETVTLWVRDALTHMMTCLVHSRGEISAVISRSGLAVPQMEYAHYKREMERHLQHLKAEKS